MGGRAGSRGAPAARCFHGSEWAGTSQKETLLRRVLDLGALRPRSCRESPLGPVHDLALEGFVAYQRRNQTSRRIEPTVPTIPIELVGPVPSSGGSRPPKCGQQSDTISDTLLKYREWVRVRSAKGWRRGLAFQPDKFSCGAMGAPHRQRKMACSSHAQ